MRGYLLAIIFFTVAGILAAAVIPIVWPYFYFFLLMVTAAIHLTQRINHTGVISDFWLNSDEKDKFISSYTSCENWQNEFNRINETIKKEGLKRRQDGGIDRRSKRGRELDALNTRLIKPYQAEKMYEELRRKPQKKWETYVGSLFLFYVTAIALASWVLLICAIYFVKYFSLIHSSHESFIVPFHLLGILNYSSDFDGFKQLEIDGKWGIFLIADILSALVAAIFSFFVWKRVSVRIPKPPLVGKGNYLKY